LLCGCEGGGVLLSLGDFRAPAFSLSVTRDDGGLEDEFEWFMQLLGTYFRLLNCSHWHRRRVFRILDINIAVFAKRPSAKPWLVQLPL
jgi:hypothetical protein